MEINFSKDYLLPIIKTWRDNKVKEGFIPTVDLLIEDLELIQEAQRLVSERD